MARALADLLRADLLAGQVVALAGTGPRAAVATTCAALGAATPALDAPLLDEQAVTRAVSALGRIDTLACDAAGPFAAAGGGLDGLRAGLDGAWNSTRAVANVAWRPPQREIAAAAAPAAGEGAGGSSPALPGGKLVLLAPRPRAGAHAAALAAALENLARTLSVEWARYGIRTSAILPGDGASDEELATLAAYLASPAGDYFSGCAFTVCGRK
jgi:citronellol/citronellal dehydrogenase